MKKQMLGVVISLLAASVSVSVDAMATPAALLQSQYRPTPQDLFDAFPNGWPLENPFINGTSLFACTEQQRTYDCRGVQASKARILIEVPVIIARLETAYPGGTYFFLGRDAMLLSDVVEAYYISVGQQGRVRRLHGSTPTIRGLNSQNGTAFLESNGFNLNPSLPAVFVDHTSFGEASQSRILYNLARQIRTNQGYGQVNSLVAVASTNGNGWDFRNIEEAEENKQRRSSEEPLKLNATTHLVTYLGFWNGSYTSGLTTHSDGSLRGQISNQFPDESKNLVLATMYEGISAAMSPEFHQRVAQEAAHYGVSMSDNRLVVIPHAAPVPEADPLVRLQEFLMTLPLDPVHEKYFSRNGQQVFRLLKEWFAGKPPAGIAEFIARTPEIFVEAHESGRLTSKDFRRLYLYLLAQIDSSDAGQIENVGRVIVLNPSLQAMLEERAKVFLTSQRYEQNARWVYMQFVEGGYLAVDQGDCESFLAEAG